MIISEQDYALDIKLSDELGSLKVFPGELVYCSGIEHDIKTGIIRNLGFGQMAIGADLDVQKNLKEKISLLFPELLFLNELSLIDNLKLYFDSTQKTLDIQNANSLFESFDLNPNEKISDLNLLQKLDFLICRSYLSKAQIIVIDSTILQLDEYHQDRIMSELILHCRENNCTLLVTKHSQRIIDCFPGRIANREAVSATV